MNRNALFVVNLHSGVRSLKKRRELRRCLQEKNIVFTKYKGHATELATQAIIQKYDVVVAVGGDGTVNEVAKGLLGSEIALGIVPLGSGNGLARHLKIPLSVEKSFELIQTGILDTIDTCSMGGIPFFCTAGIGFDALVAHRFALKGKRGLATYIRTAVESYTQFKTPIFRLIINDKLIEQQLFAVTFANASQYGNNAYIAPLAKVNDGLIDVCLLKPFPITAAASIGQQLFKQKLHRSPFLEIKRTTRIQLLSDEPIIAHYDGEPIFFQEKQIEIQIFPNTLKVIRG